MPIIGTALAGRAVDELATAARIPAFTIASLLGGLERGERLDVGTIVIVDEAAMVGTRQLAALARHVWDVHGKVVLVGDPHQLPAIDAGGLLAGLARRLPIIELAENRRQQALWEQIALSELRAGDPERSARHVHRARPRPPRTDPRTAPQPARRRLVDASESRAVSRSSSPRTETTSATSTNSPASECRPTGN